MSESLKTNIAGKLLANLIAAQLFSFFNNNTGKLIFFKNQIRTNMKNCEMPTNNEHIMMTYTYELIVHLPSVSMGTDEKRVKKRENVKVRWH